LETATAHLQTADPQNVAKFIYEARESFIDLIPLCSELSEELLIMASQRR